MNNLEIKDSNGNWTPIKPIQNLTKRQTHILINNFNCFNYVTTAYLEEFYFYNLKTETSNVINTMPCLIISRSEWEWQGGE